MFTHNFKLKHFIAALIFVYCTILLLEVIFSTKSHINIPNIVWWTPFVPGNRTISCYNDNYQCLVTDMHNMSNIEAYLFYGSSIEQSDLPQKMDNTCWAIYHEESPKNWNAFLDRRVHNLFNIAATFSLNSEMPLPLQYLKDIDSLFDKKYWISTNRKNQLLENQAPVLYIQSDCDTPINRDMYVEELMKYIAVDSYGKCVNNRELPKYLKFNGTYDVYEDQFMRFIASYKFIISIENAKCDDYLTEKLWRPLIVGSIPIYLGATNINKWLPNDKSAILFENYKSIKDLADYIHTINNNDKMYNSFLTHKAHGQISNMMLKYKLNQGYYGIPDNNEEYVPMAFECFVCKAVHENSFKKSNIRNASIYSCDNPYYNINNDLWTWHWQEAKVKADQLLKRIKYNSR